MVVHVSGKALRRRRDDMSDSARVLTESACDEATACLLLFYAAECGLKERVLARGNHRDTSGLEPTHDLRRLAKDLRLPPNLSSHLTRLQQCRRNNGKPNDASALPIHELHQAWRYGAKLRENDQENAQKALSELIKWCRNGP